MAKHPDLRVVKEETSARLNVENISVMFPAHSGVQDTASAHRDERMIWGKNGRLRGVRALTDISFELNQGDRLAIVGLNGSGKTTLLQTLAGIFSPNTGQITAHGRVTSLININLGIQAEATGHHNILLRGLAAGLTRKQIESKRQEIVEFSELGEFLDMPMETYSAGMRMRLIFAIATTLDPEILILDEWLSAGDTAFKQKATARMQEFVANARILVLASHSRKLLLDNCDQALWLDGGRMRQLGPVEEVLDAYESAASQDRPQPPYAVAGK